ncbi:MAG: hypothetical protein ACLQQ4_04700 [Bacteroidia bacterium]
MEKKDIMLKEIDLIQTVITRMANNSFLLKGWLISIVAVVIALTKDSILKDLYVPLFLLVPILTFWYLDAYFLRLERIYRDIYEWVIKNRLNSDEHIFELAPVPRTDKKIGDVYEVMGSQTLRVFYGIPLAAIVIMALVKIFCFCCMFK